MSIVFDGTHDSISVCLGTNPTEQFKQRKPGNMLANLINEHALADAQAEKWDAVAERLNALRQTVTVGRVGGKASLSALVQNGIDPNQVIAAMRSVPMASELLNTLTASGVDWADDMTAYVMSGLVAAGKITQQTADVMRSLSVRSDAVIVTTEAECESAYESHRLAQQWSTLQNEVINPSVENRADLIAALKSAIETLEAG